MKKPFRLSSLACLLTSKSRSGPISMEIYRPPSLWHKGWAYSMLVREKELELVEAIGPSTKGQRVDQEGRKMGSILLKKRRGERLRSPSQKKKENKDKRRAMLGRRKSRGPSSAITMVGILSFATAKNGKKPKRSYRTWEKSNFTLFAHFGRWLIEVCRGPKSQERERPRTCTQGNTLTRSWANQIIALTY